MKKNLFKNIIIIETVIILLLGTIFISDYISNNTIWNLIIHHKEKETLLYKNKSPTSNGKVLIYKKDSLSLFDMYIRIEIIFNDTNIYSYSTTCYSNENLDFNNPHDVNVTWNDSIPTISIRNHPIVYVKYTK